MVVLCICLVDKVLCVCVLLGIVISQHLNVFSEYIGIRWYV